MWGVQSGEMRGRVQKASEAMPVKDGLFVIKSRVKKVYANPALDGKIAAGLRAHPTWTYEAIAEELNLSSAGPLFVGWKDVARLARRLGLKR